MTEVLHPPTLAEARDTLRQALMQGEAVTCPLCTQLAKIYRRKITSRMAFTLIEVWNASQREWCHVPTTVTFTGDSGEVSKLRYWGLVEEATDKREDGGRAGWWRITEEGEQWVRGHRRVGKYARVYDGRCLGIETDEWVSITDALGDKFNYEELMSR